MLIFEILLNLKSKQSDITAAFLHADLGKDEKMFVEMPLLRIQQEGKGIKTEYSSLWIKVVPARVFEVPYQGYE